MGTGIILALLAIAGSTAFRKGSNAAARTSVGMDLPFSPCVAQYEAAPRPQALSNSPLELLPQKLIRSAKLSLEVKDFPRFEKGCRQLAGRLGYLADLRVSSEEDGRKRADLTLRVAADRFDSALVEFKSLGVVKKEELSVEDVTRATPIWKPAASTSAPRPPDSGKSSPIGPASSRT